MNSKYRNVILRLILFYRTKHLNEQFLFKMKKIRSFLYFSEKTPRYVHAMICSVL